MRAAGAVTDSRFCHERLLDDTTQAAFFRMSEEFAMTAAKSDSAVLPSYDLTMPPLVRFGTGRVTEVGEVAATLGRRIWLVTGGSSYVASGAQSGLESSLTAAGLPAVVVARSAGEPTVSQLATALADLPPERADVVVVAVGGGATIDFAKALAALATNV